MSSEFAKYIIGKLTSGRWIITVAATFVFVYLSIYEILPIDKVMEILLIVIYAYFSRPRPDVNGGNGNNTTPPKQ